METVRKRVPGANLNTTCFQTKMTGLSKNNLWQVYLQKYKYIHVFFGKNTLGHTLNM